jgi:RNA polymerase sigma factor (sigma-70 family)
MITDNNSVRGCPGGDLRAFEGIVNRYQDLVCAITYSAVGQRDLSEELAQEPFVQAWIQRGQLREPDKFGSWLCSIARSTVCNYLREEKRKPVVYCSLEGMPASTDAETPPETLIRHEEEEMIRRALMQIPQEYREPLVLFYRQDQSTHQVAEMMGLTEAAVRTRLHRGRQMLREEMESRIETTLKNTAPGAAFTRSVMGVVGAGLAAGVAGTAAAAGAGKAVGGVMAGMQAKIIAAAAVAAIGTGTVVTYHHYSKPEPTDPVVVESEEYPWAPQRAVTLRPERSALSSSNIISIDDSQENQSGSSLDGSNMIARADAIAPAEAEVAIDATDDDEFNAWLESLFAETTGADAPKEQSSNAAAPTGGMGGGMMGGMVMGGGFGGGMMMGGMVMEGGMGMGGGMIDVFGRGMGGYRIEIGEDGEPILREYIPDETEDGEP